MISQDIFQKLQEIEKKIFSASKSNNNDNIDSILAEAAKMIFKIKSMDEFKEINSAEQNLDELFESIKKYHLTSPKSKNNHVADEMLPWTNLICALERKGIAEEHAEKLSKIFPNRSKALKYLLNFTKQHKNSNSFMYDACLFHIPNMMNKKSWPSWKSLAEKNLLDDSFRESILPHSEDIESLITTTCPKNKSKRPNAKLISNMEKKIQALNRKVTVLKKKHGSLTTEEEKEYRHLIAEHSAAQLERANLGSPFNSSITITALKAYYEKYLMESPTYNIFIKNGLNRKDFAKFNTLKIVNSDEKIPNILIDGNKLELPNYYLMKMPIDQEIYAAKAACLGKLTNCCQSLSGEAGEPCVIYGLTNDNSGFYILCEGDFKNPSINDPILAQAWAWRSKKGNIVLDSIEVSEEKNIPAATKMFGRLSEVLVNENESIKKVLCGQGSGIGEQMLEAVAENQSNLEEFINYGEYSDALKRQLPIFNQKTPYFFGWENSEDIPDSALPFINIQLETNPISKAFVEMIEHAILNNNDRLIELIQSQTDEHPRKKEIYDIIKNISNFLINPEKKKRLLDDLSNHSYLLLLNIDVETLINDCLMENQTEAAIQIIEEYLTIDTVTQYSESLLKCAIQYHNNTIFDKLINMNDLIKNEHGESLLKCAIKHHNEDAFNKLISCTFNTNEMVIHAIECQNLYFFNKLIEHENFDCNHVDSNNRTFLMHAIKSNIHDFTSKLLDMNIEMNIDLDTRDRQGKTALFHAIDSGNQEVVSKLISVEVNLNILDAFKKTALMSAITLGKTNMAILLIQNNADVNLSNELGENALTYAMHKNNIAIFSLLVDAGSDINIKNKDGTPLILSALENNQHEFAEKISQSNALDYNATNQQEQNALIYSIIYNAENVFSTLVQKTNVNTCDIYKKTPLIYALKNGNKDMVSNLIKVGAHVNGNADSNLNPLTFAINSGQIELVNILLHAGADVNLHGLDGKTPLIHAIEKGNKEIVLALLNKTNVNACDNKKKTPLMYSKNSEITEALINLGANINVIDNTGKTPLMYASTLRKSDVVLVLLEHYYDSNNKNINIDQTDNGGKTALLYAAHLSSKEVIKALLKNSASVESKDKNNRNLQFYLKQNKQFRNQKAAKEIKVLVKKYTQNNSNAHNLLVPHFKSKTIIPPIVDSKNNAIIQNQAKKPRHL